ncbi:MAG: hypothetical protein O3B76_00270 [Proteobacteria bacterium]|nr:hypothetical protein [Pseudomonadota bacterium]MDA1021855.1 hypothetical protein [Pseudomonadota bacterium]
MSPTSPTSPWGPKPTKAFKGDKCVEPVDVMRRDHMNYLLHQRDETVQQGIRGKKYSLRQCIECHAVPDKQAGGERTVEPFCGECHKFAAVTIDCFQCHTNKPEKVKSTEALPSGPLPPGHPTMNKKTSNSTNTGSWKKKTLFAALDPALQQGSTCNVQVR